MCTGMQDALVLWDLPVILSIDETSCRMMHDGRYVLPFFSCHSFPHSSWFTNVEVRITLYTCYQGNLWYKITKPKQSQ